MKMADSDAVAASVADRKDGVGMHRYRGDKELALESVSRSIMDRAVMDGNYC